VQTENPNKPWMIKQFSLITANSRIWISNIYLVIFNDNKNH
jgi:hypothetical protein